jgi:2-phosphosulfolactate phosphatase
VRIDVFFGPSTLTPVDVQERVVVVIDVFRASTTITVAIANGARRVIPYDSAEAAIAAAKTLASEGIVLAGERRMFRIDGFDLGNSPAEFTAQMVRGKSVILTTTNGTGALVAAAGAREVLVGAFVNFSAVLRRLRVVAEEGADVSIVCAGRDRQFSLEDAVCAGGFVRGLARCQTAVELNDAALAARRLQRSYRHEVGRLRADAGHGRALTAAGFGGDLTLCTTLDAYPVVPVYAERQVTRQPATLDPTPPPRARSR